MHTEVNPKPAIGQMSVDATIIAKRLAKAEFGEFIPYAELTALIGRNVQSSQTGGARHILDTARETVLRENQIGFATVEGEGIRRMTDEELAESSEKPLRHIQRTAKKAARVVLCANMEKLTPDQQRKVSTGLSVLGAVEIFSATKSQRAIEETLKPSAIPQKVNVEELAQLFGKK